MTWLLIVLAVLIALACVAIGMWDERQKQKRRR